MAKLRVHASIIQKLGSELITNDIMAIIELIKNSYDADATWVKVEIDTKTENDLGNGLITVTDDGIGMSEKEITNGWLVISNSLKRKKKQAGEFSTKKRWMIGEKGLGRLATQRLGKAIQIRTKKANSNIEYSLIINWDLFSEDKTVEDIEFDLVETVVDSKDHYTILNVYGLNDSLYWDETKNVQKLSREFSQIISPFINDFEIFAFVNSTPIIYDDFSERIYDFCDAKHVFQIQNNVIELVSIFKIPYFYKNKKQMVVPGEDVVKEFFELYQDKLSRRGYELFEEDNSVKIRKKTSLSIFDQKIDEGIFEKTLDIGKIDCELYTFGTPSDTRKESVNAFQDAYKKMNIGNYIKNNYGVKIIKNNFYVYPYGISRGDDWLGLADYQEKSGSYYGLPRMRTIGYVKLEDQKSDVLMETTNREGFIKNAFYDYLVGICKLPTSNINSDRTYLSRLYNDYIDGKISMAEPGESYHYASSRNIERALKDSKRVMGSVSKDLIKTIGDKTNNKKSLEEAKKVVSSLSEDDSVNQKARETLNRLITNLECELRKQEQYEELYKSSENTIQIIENQLTVIEDEIEFLNEQINDMIEVSGLGMSAEMISHELLAQINVIKDNLVDLGNNYPDDKNIKRTQRTLIHNLNSLRKLVSFIMPGTRNVRLNKVVQNVSTYIDDFRLRHSISMEKRNIELVTNIESDDVFNFVPGILNQVLDNLYDNSKYWLDLANIVNKKFCIEYVNGNLTVYDNGFGISPSDEFFVFGAFNTKKFIDGKKGRGLGLYISENLLNMNASSIRLLNEINKYGNYYKFQISMSKHIEVSDND